MIELVKNEVCVSKIMLDPLNPRFAGTLVGLNQSELQERIRTSPEHAQAFKELHNSMKIGLQWVNSIVVRKVCELSEEKKKMIPEYEKYEYIVVEGNTRLACLKTDTLGDTYGENMKVPVLVAEKEDMDDASFENELRAIQARCNIMIVKEWNDNSKFRHLYNMYKGEKEEHPDWSFRDVVDYIKNTTSGSFLRVQKSIIRCIIAEKIQDEVCPLAPSYWPYIEAWEVTDESRRTIGLNADMEFSFDGKGGEWQRELIKLFPRMVADAHNKKINGKKFRDKYKELIDRYNGDPEMIYTEIMDIMDEKQENKTWQLDTTEGSNEDKWNSDLDGIIKMLKAFPACEDWAGNQINKLEEIIERIERILKVING